jgi:hypothetical protein
MIAIGANCKLFVLHNAQVRGRQTLALRANETLTTAVPPHILYDLLSLKRFFRSLSEVEDSTDLSLHVFVRLMSCELGNH